MNGQGQGEAVIQAPGPSVPGKCGCCHHGSEKGQKLCRMGSECLWGQERRGSCWFPWSRQLLVIGCLRLTLTMFPLGSQAGWMITVPGWQPYIHTALSMLRISRRGPDTPGSSKLYLVPSVRTNSSHFMMFLWISNCALDWVRGDGNLLKYHSLKYITKEGPRQTWEGPSDCGL
jgi:hypothetical protein